MHTHTLLQGFYLLLCWYVLELKMTPTSAVKAMAMSEELHVCGPEVFELWWFYSSKPFRKKLKIRPVCFIDL